MAPREQHQAEITFPEGEVTMRFAPFKKMTPELWALVRGETSRDETHEVEQGAMGDSDPDPGDSDPDPSPAGPLTKHK